MIILDENIPESQWQLLRSWRIRPHLIGAELSEKGIQDDNLIGFLIQQRRPTFFTRDGDFYDRRLCHSRYCLVYLAVRPNESASFVRRLLRHPGTTEAAEDPVTSARGFLSPQGSMLYAGIALVAISSLYVDRRAEGGTSRGARSRLSVLSP